MMVVEPEAGNGAPTSAAGATSALSSMDWSSIEALIQTEVAKQQSIAAGEWRQMLESSLARTQRDLRLEITDAEQKLVQMVEAARSEVDAYGETQQAFMLELKIVGDAAEEARDAKKIAQAITAGAAETGVADVWQALTSHASKAARVAAAEQGAKQADQFQANIQDLAEHAKTTAREVAAMSGRCAELKACLEATDRRCSDALAQSVQRLESEMHSMQQELKAKFDQSQTCSASMLAPSLAEASQSDVASMLSAAPRSAPTSPVSPTEGCAPEQTAPRRGSPDQLRRSRREGPGAPTVLTLQSLSEARISRSRQHSAASSEASLSLSLRARLEQDVIALKDAATQEAAAQVEDDAAAAGATDARNFWSRQDRAARTARSVPRDASFTAAEEAPLERPPNLLEARSFWSRQARAQQQEPVKQQSPSAVKPRSPATSPAMSPAASPQQAARAPAAVTPTTMVHIQRNGRCGRPRGVPTSMSVGPRYVVETRRPMPDNEGEDRPSVQILRQRFERSRRSEPSINPWGPGPTRRQRVASMGPGIVQGRPPLPSGARSPTSPSMPPMPPTPTDHASTPIGSGKCMGAAIRRSPQQPSYAAAAVGA